MRAEATTANTTAATGTAWGILTAISLCHTINDVMQSMLAAIYPLLQVEFSLSYAQIGVMTFAFQVTASLLQPLIGMATDRHPQPRSLPFGMASTFCGVLLLAFAHHYGMLLAGAMLIGVGSAVFHPESSRVARLASGGRFGTAQSLFQMGGNFGQSLGPLLAAFIVVPLGRPAVAWFAVAAALAAESIDLLGVHCHIGSQIFEAEGFGLAAGRVLEFLAEVKAEHGVELAELDLGGGHGIAYTAVDEPRPAAEIADALADDVQKTVERLGLRCPRVSLEPGRAISGPAGLTLYTVGVTKTVDADAPDGATAARRYVAVDGGMSDNPRPVLYDADYTAVSARRTSEAEPALSRVVGKHCESGDILVRDVYLPADLGRGDLLAVPATGAYTHVMSSNYNALARPAVVAVSGGQARVIIRRETQEDLFAREADPRLAR